ncbi:MAG: hypothetical protein RRY15_06380 [Bacteroidales bacterium]
MKIVEKVRDFFWKRAVYQVLSNNKRRKKSISLSEAKSVGIYADYTDEKQFAQIQSLGTDLQKQGVSVKTLLYVDANIKPEHIMENTYLGMFTRRDLAFNRVPKIELLTFYKQFMQTDFDILLDLSLKSNYQDVYILASSQARFKVGKNEGPWSEKVNDLSFVYANGTSLTEYIKLIMQYIENFKSDNL